MKWYWITAISLLSAIGIYALVAYLIGKGIKPFKTKGDPHDISGEPDS